MISIAPELMEIYAFWGSILAFKLFGCLLLIGHQRFTKKVFMNPEDTGFSKGGKVIYNDPDVERARRAHQNDLENIPVWFFVTLVYLTTGPPVWLASMLIKLFVFARITHTFVYAVIPNQPSRAIAFFIGLGITLFQIAATMWHYC